MPFAIVADGAVGPAGREFGVPDDNEFIVIHTAPLLDVKDCRGKGRNDCDYGWMDGSGHDGRAKECRPAKE